MPDILPWGKHCDDADKADKLSAMELANGNQKRAEFWRNIADQKRVDATRAIEIQLPKGLQR